MQNDLEAGGGAFQYVAGRRRIRFEDLTEGEREIWRFVLEAVTGQTAALGSAVQKHIAVANMGGVAALLAFAGTKGLDAAGYMVVAFWAFGAGLALVTLSMACSYHLTTDMYQTLLADLTRPSGPPPTPPAKKFFKRIEGRLVRAAIWWATPLSWLAFLALLIGMLCGGLALRNLSPPASTEARVEQKLESPVPVAPVIETPTPLATGPADNIASQGPAASQPPRGEQGEQKKLENQDRTPP